MRTLSGLASLPLGVIAWTTHALSIMLSISMLTAVDVPGLSRRKKALQLEYVDPSLGAENAVLCSHLDDAKWALRVLHPLEILNLLAIVREIELESAHFVHYKSRFLWVQIPRSAA